MTNENSTGNHRPAGGPGCRTDDVVGYGRPPKETRFKPGQSGNPKGRPKQRQSVKAMLREVYTDTIAMHDGEKWLRVMRLKALLIKQWERGIKGDERATQAAIAIAKELGAFDAIEADNDSDRNFLSRETIRLLSDQALKELIAIERRRVGDLKKH